MAAFSFYPNVDWNWLFVLHLSLIVEQIGFLKKIGFLFKVFVQIATFFRRVSRVWFGDWLTVSAAICNQLADYLSGIFCGWFPMDFDDWRRSFRLWTVGNCSIVQLLLPWFVVAIPHRYFSIVLVSDQVSLRFEWFATSCWSSWLIFGHFPLDFRSNLAVFWSCSNPLRSGGLFRSISAPCSIQNGIIDGRYNWFQQSWGHETTTDAS